MLVPGNALFSIVMVLNYAVGGEPFVLLAILQDFINSLAWSIICSQMSLGKEILFGWISPVWGYREDVRGSTWSCFKRCTPLLLFSSSLPNLVPILMFQWEAAGHSICIQMLLVYEFHSAVSVKMSVIYICLFLSNACIGSPKLPAVLLCVLPSM